MEIFPSQPPDTSDTRLTIPIFHRSTLSRADVSSSSLVSVYPRSVVQPVRKYYSRAQLCHNSYIYHIYHVSCHLFSRLLKYESCQEIFLCYSISTFGLSASFLNLSFIVFVCSSQLLYHIRVKSIQVRITEIASDTQYSCPASEIFNI